MTQFQIFQLICSSKAANKCQQRINKDQNLRATIACIYWSGFNYLIKCLLAKWKHLTNKELRALIDLLPELLVFRKP